MVTPDNIAAPSPTQTFFFITTGPLDFNGLYFGGISNDSNLVSP